MSKQKWAAIVYGRSYHLDFRFITIPQDFTAKEVAWVSPYILATTQKARNLIDYPRWSLFKNNSHCVVGVTCMVRDLIGKLGEDSIEVMAKDDLGRPLYVFVGYVTQLDQSKNLDSLPAYAEGNLTSFKSLYQEVEQVWLARDFDSRKPLSSEYRSLHSAMEIAASPTDAHEIIYLNNQKKDPDRTFLWQQSNSQDRQLWLRSSRCMESTSICLNIKENYLINSPFLNQTITNLEQFTVEPRITHAKETSLKSSSAKTKAVLDMPSFRNTNSSFKQKISARARQDIDLTIQQAAKITSVSQDIVHNFNKESIQDNSASEKPNLSSTDLDDFGFKSKKDSSSLNKQDWF